MTTALGDVVAAVASPDAIAVGTDPGTSSRSSAAGDNSVITPRAREVVVGSLCAPDAVAMRPALGDAAAAVAVAARAHDAVAMSLNTRQQLVLSPAARDHATTTEGPGKVIAAAPRSAPDAVTTTAVSGGAVAAIATTPRARAAVAMSPDSGQQLALSTAAGDHVATVARPQKVNVAALRSPDDVTTNTALEGYRREGSPQRSQLHGGGAASLASGGWQQGARSRWELSRQGRAQRG